MKLKYIFSSMVIAVTAMCGFTSCSDDNEPAPANNQELVLTPDTRVKVGAENRLALPVESGNGDYRAFSLNPEVVDVVEENGQFFLEGIKNGTARVVISDGANQYKQLVVGVYTTEEMTLKQNTVELTTIVGKSSTVSNLAVDLGNGFYQIESSDPRVNATLTDVEFGIFSLTAAAEDDPYDATVTITDQSGLSASVTINVSKSTERVKIGTSTRQDLPIDASAGEAEIEMVSTNGTAKVEGTQIEGLANGVAVVKITQGDKVKQLSYSIYTTDVMKLNETNYTVTSPLGISATISSLKVVEGNGEYTVTCDNDAVKATVDPTTGVVSLNVKAKKDNYSATVTVSDCTGLTASCTVTVTATFDPFTDSEIEDLRNPTEEDCYIASYRFTQNRNSDFSGWYRDDGTWKNADNGNGTWTVGWWETYWGSDYGGHYITYPSDAAIDQEVNATYEFKAGYGNSYNPKYTMQGKAKLLRDDSDWKVVIWYNVDMENEAIERGWVIFDKNSNN